MSICSYRSRWRHNYYLTLNLGSDDIDLYRGAANTARKGIYTMPADEGWDVATSGEIVTPLFKQTQ